MEKIFEEILNTQSSGTRLSSDKALVLKTIYLILALSSIAYPKPHLYLVLAILGVGLVLYIRLYRTLVLVTVMWMMTALLLVAIGVAFSSNIERLLLILQYVYPSMLSIIIYVSTTSPKQLYRLTGLNPISLSYLMLRNVLEEIRDIMVACRSRGYEPGLNPIKYVNLLGNIVIVMGYRLKTAEESLRSRGLE